MQCRLSTLFVGACVFLSACQTIRHQTASGRPEVTIKAPIDKVKAAYVGAVVNANYSLKTDTPLQVVMEREATNALVGILLASNYDSRVMARISTTFIQNGTDTRVFADLNLVTNPGSAFERLTPMNNSVDSVGVQNILNDIKQGIEAGKQPAQVASDATAAMQQRKTAAAR